jgi:cation diffusion facilitator CzcD-associated flavoprotein CzcO
MPAKSAAAGTHQTAAVYRDILVVGAGISGIGAAYYLKTRLASSTFEVLDRNASLGGTWSLFKYPGVRTDSDMFTFSFSFHPWKSAVQFASAAAILEYLDDVVDTYDLRRYLRFGAHVVEADFSTVDSTWRIRTAAGKRYRCRHLVMAAGYYDVDEGHTPDIPMMDVFRGTLVHTQHWPAEGLDCAGKRVVVIGSGATAITTVPILAKRAAHVTMLQRSPTYIVGERKTILPVPLLVQRSLDALGPHSLFASLYYGATRHALVALTTLFYQFCRALPGTAKKLTLYAAQKRLGADVNMVHFTPRYDMWDQRVCFAPDGDFFSAVRRGGVSVVTACIERVSPTGIVLLPGSIAEEEEPSSSVPGLSRTTELDADVIVLATGLKLAFAGKVAVSIDGVPIEPSDHVTCVVWHRLACGRGDERVLASVCFRASMITVADALSLTGATLALAPATARAPPSLLSLLSLSLFFPSIENARDGSPVDAKEVVDVAVGRLIEAWEAGGCIDEHSMDQIILYVKKNVM